ncbi:MAG: hypothetical protein PHN80_16360 [Hespellia sp.]|nr:hypothetical protein [Hespellia sp.]
MSKRVRLSNHQKKSIAQIRQKFGNKWFKGAGCRISYTTLDALTGKGFLEKKDLVQVTADQLSYNVIGAEYRYIKD